MPDTIGNLKELEWLKVCNNQLVSLPKEIGKLCKLKMLDLRYNKLSSLPKEIGKLLLLEWLVLNNNKLTILPEEIGGLNHLRTLNLSHNKLEGLPKEIGKLLLLEWLDLEDNQLKIIPYAIADLPRLERLNLKSNKLESLELKNPNPTLSEVIKKLTEKSSKLPALTWLDLEDNQLKSLPEEIGNFQGIEWLNISRNKLMKLPSAFNKLRNLKNLNLSRNQITYLLDNFGNLQALKTLDVSHNQLKTLPHTIKWLPVLEWLNLSQNKLEDFPLENFQVDIKCKRLPMLKWLNLSYNSLTQLPEKMGKLEMLEKLNVSHNKLKKTVPREIGKLLMLKELDLSHNYIENLPDEMGRLVNLTELRLNHNDIVNLPHTFGLLKKMTKLNVSYNKLKTLTYTMNKLEGLKELDVSHNELIVVRGKISDLKNLEWLNLSYNPNLRTLPLMKMTKLSSQCEIELTGCKLFKEVQLELKKTIHEPHYKGPLIIYPAVEMQEETKSVEESLAYLYGLNPIELPNLEITPELTYWLGLVSNPKIAQETKKQEFSHKIVSYLEHANENQEFREIFYAIIKDAEKTLGDKVAISTLNLAIAHKLSTIALGDMKELADFLKGVWIVNILGQIVRNKVPTFPVFDKTEVDLGSPAKLREELNLSVDVQDMLYFTCSALNQEDLQEAKKQALNKLSDQEAYFEFLINNGKWQEGLQLKYPKEFAVMENAKNKTSDKSDLTKENKAIIKKEFDQKLKELTRKAL